MRFIFKIAVIIFIFATIKLNAGNLNEFYGNNKDYSKYEKASARVSQWMDFPYETILGWGYAETRHNDLYAFNIPEWRYSNGKVYRFSVDVGWCQINSQNWDWVYKAAIKLQEQGKIPKEVRLYKFNNEILKKHTFEYNNTKMNIKALKRIFKPIKMTPQSQNTLESFAIYRVIIERMRNRYDWDKECEQFLKPTPFITEDKLNSVG